MRPHHVFYGQLEGGDLSDDLIVSFHLVHTLRQVLETHTQTNEYHKFKLMIDINTHYTHTYSHGIKSCAEVVLIRGVSGVLHQLLQAQTHKLLSKNINMHAATHK